jgi:benzoate/toluate 1,2-dioxygenase alpha subunit
MQDSVKKTLATVLEDNAKVGTYRVARDIFTDPEIFELEMKHIFEGNWIYLAHSPTRARSPTRTTISQLNMGRQPIFIARNRDGELNAFINACSHRGAMLCRFKRGSRVIFTCPFHGWTFTNSGKLLKVKNPEGVSRSASPFYGKLRWPFFSSASRHAVARSRSSTPRSRRQRR